MKSQRKKNKYCRLCRKRIIGHGNRFYCDREDCKARKKAIRKKQLVSAKRKYKVNQQRTNVRLKTLQKEKRLDEVKLWLKEI